MTELLAIIARRERRVLPSGSVYVSVKSPALIEKSAPSGMLAGSTSGIDISSNWSARDATFDHW